MSGKYTAPQEQVSGRGEGEGREGRGGDGREEEGAVYSTSRASEWEG